MGKGVDFMIKKTIEIKEKEGLHARPASMLVKTAMKYKSDLGMYLEGNTNKIYKPKSILSIMSLGIANGDKVTFTADGEDEKEAIESIEQLIANNFQA
jgi:phosphocarrier protein